ncbi:MAG: cytochrome b N-terminal domain-containing protein [Gemmatimonadota bacterium]|nr:cytochrome b N-terminal domain-containing protein [Gemmatimonadota bacterium]
MRRILAWLDDRVDLVGIRRVLLDRKMPSELTWWHTLGSATLTVFTVQVVTGIVLAMSYSASPDHAYDSILYLQQHVLSGALVRGLHHWGASAMVVLVMAHMIRVFTMGSYKYPREVNWLLGVGLFFIVMGFGFTGYLLPWDQKAYWATQVGTNIAGTTPVVGETLVKLLRGGTQLGAATLARFYALHVLLLPVLLVSVVLVHLTLVVRQGIAPRAHVLEKNAPARTTDPAYPAYYEETYAASKGEGVPFWPNIIAKDLIVATGVILVLLLLAHFKGAGLEPPADPTDTSYVPRPEWYFLPFYQLLKLVPGSMEAAVAAGLPALMVLVLLMLPFFDKRSKRMLAHRPVARLALFGVLGASAFLIGASVRDEPPAVPPEVGHPLNSVQRAGRALFKAQQCGSCHAVAGVSTPDKNSDVPDAPDLTDIGLHHSASWMHSFLEDPSRFHTDSKMPAFGPPTLSHEEIEEISQYLATLRGPHGDAKEPQFVDTFPEPKKLQEHP